MSRRHLWRWLPGHLWRRTVRRPGRPRRVIVTVCDHFEPFWRGATPEVADSRVAAWTGRLPQLAARYRDDDGLPPRHTFFCAMDEMTGAQISRLSGLAGQGLAELELHLHHRADTADSLRQQLLDAKGRLARFGSLSRDEAQGTVHYGFIHGNWALANTRPDGDWCGVDGELRVLRDTGCYADFTFPSAPDPTQPRMTNALYYPPLDATGPGSLDRGAVCRAGRRQEERLLLVTGPLCLNAEDRKWHILPRIENGALRRGQDVTPRRIRRWIAQHIHVAGRPDWAFVKLYCHGAQERDWDVLLGGGYHRLHEGLRTECDRAGCSLHYASAREMVNMIRALEDGWTGTPNEARAHWLTRYE